MTCVEAVKFNSVVNCRGLSKCTTCGVLGNFDSDVNDRVLRNPTTWMTKKDFA